MRERDNEERERKVQKIETVFCMRERKRQKTELVCVRNCERGGRRERERERSETVGFIFTEREGCEKERDSG